MAVQDTARYARPCVLDSEDDIAGSRARTTHTHTHTHTLTTLQLSLPLAAVAAGPLADFVFEPAFASPDASAAARMLGSVIGTGKGRGVAALFIALGLTNAACAAAGLMYSPLRRVDTDLPDLLTDKRHETSKTK